MKPSAVLDAARDILRDPRKWTKGAYARDRTGKSQDIPSRDSARLKQATSYCIQGAVAKVLGGFRRRNLFDVCSTYMELAAGVKCIHLLNDDPRTTHKDAMKVLAKASALAMAKEKRCVVS